MAIRKSAIINELRHRIKVLKVQTLRYYINTFHKGSIGQDEITKYSGSSFTFGKMETIQFIQRICPDRNSRILDVGPGRGIYNHLLRDVGYKHFDAVEIYLPYIVHFKLNQIYHQVFHRNIVGFEYEPYDIIVMGDVLEHLKVRQAKKVIEYAQAHSKLLIVAVPYQLKQIGCQLDGSGDHKQSDLTRNVFLKRYPGFELLIDNNQLGVFFSKS